METENPASRSQIGIGTLAVFIAMVLVALIAGGVLIETTGLLQGKSAGAGQGSADRVTDRVGVESATASYSSGNMQRIDILLSKAPGSGDIDLSEVVVHWLGPNGSTEVTSSTFSISPVKGSGTVLEERSDRMNVSTFGKTIPDGTPATVRFITADGGTTTVILRPPNAPPSDGAVSLLWRSPSGNPASGTGTPTATATATATATPVPTPYSKFEWNYSDGDVIDIAVSESRVFSNSRILSTTELRELNPNDGSVTTQTLVDDTLSNAAIDNKDRYVLTKNNVDLMFWDPTNNTTTNVSYPSSSVDQTIALDTYSGDIYLSQEMDGNTGEIERRQSDGSLVWEKQLSSRAFTPIVATDSAVYTAMVRDTLTKRDHSNGDVQWSKEIVDGELIRAVHAGSGDYLYVGTDDGGLHQLYKANGTETSFSFQHSGVVDSIDTDDQGYIYIDDRYNFTVVDPSDGSVVLRRGEFSDQTAGLTIRSDGVYLLVLNTKVSKLTVHNLP